MRDALAELFFGKIAFEFAIDADGNATRFLADDDGDRVGLLGQTNGGAMAQTGRAIMHFPLGDRENASGSGDAILGDDHASIV